jgi:hypothetical protein
MYWIDEQRRNRPLQTWLRCCATGLVSWNVLYDDLATAQRSSCPCFSCGSRRNNQGNDNDYTDSLLFSGQHCCLESFGSERRFCILLVLPWNQARDDYREPNANHDSISHVLHLRNNRPIKARSIGDSGGEGWQENREQACLLEQLFRQRGHILRLLLLKDPNTYSHCW